MVSATMLRICKIYNQVVQCFFIPDPLVVFVIVVVLVVIIINTVVPRKTIFIPLKSLSYENIVLRNEKAH